MIYYRHNFTMIQSDNHTNHHFITRDTALAAWLLINDINLISVLNEHPAQFSFDNSGKKATKLAVSYQIGTAEGNIISFYRAYKYLLSKIKNGP